MAPQAPRIRPMSATRETFWRRWALAATAAAVAGVGAAAWLATRPAASSGIPPDVRDEVVAALVAAAGGAWDAARDPDVARLLQPGLEDRAHHGQPIDSNRFGLRERAYELSKPAGTFRVVLLGDSFVYGLGVAADQRLGAQLETELDARLRGGAERVECLHFGLGSWNIRAGCAFLRRQLDLLQPDLVVHVSVWNDIDDTAGARGFGAMGEYTPQRPEQLGLVLRSDWPQTHLGVDRDNYLVAGLDWEAQRRYARAAADLVDLAAAVEAAGGRYLHVAHWTVWAPIAARRLTAGLDPDQVLFTSVGYYMDRDNWVTAVDAHWGVAGHRRTAIAIAGAALERGLFDPLVLAPWPEALEGARVFDEGAAEAAAEPDLPRLFSAQRIESALSNADVATVRAAQVYGGVERGGVLGPFASILLARDGGGRVEAAVAGLGRAELAGLRVSLEVDGVELAEGEVPVDGELELTSALTDEQRGRPFLNVRLVADDYAYAGDDLRQLVSARLVRVAIR